MDVRIAVPDKQVSKEILDAGLEMNTRVSEALIRDGEAPTFTQAVKQGLQWKPEPPGQERFDHAATIARRGWGDCDDIAPHRAASLRVTGIDPNARAVAYKSGPGRWHAIVQRGDGTLEDPSRTAGMRVREGSFAAGIAPAVVGIMGYAIEGGSVRPFVAVRRDSEGYIARVDVPVEGEDFALSCVQRGPSPSRALSGCMAGACMVGGTSELVGTEQLDRMWALHGLMKGCPANEVVGVCGVEATKDALETLEEIAPELVRELRKHWQDARVLRQDFERRKAAAASPLGKPQSSVGQTDWEARLGHGRVPSPYEERWGDRGRAFVGAATSSPYSEMWAQHRTWGIPRSGVSEQTVSGDAVRAACGTATMSPYLQRWIDHRDWGVARAGVSEQAVGAATESPYMKRWVEHRDWGVARAGVSEQAIGAGLPIRPTLSFSLAGTHHPHHRHHHHASHHRARHIIHHVHFGYAIDGAFNAPEIIGWDLFKDVLEPAGKSISRAAEGFVKDPLKTISHVGQDVLKGAQGVISLVPGIGTGISAAIGAGLAIVEGGSPIEVAVKAAYGAIPIPPGIRSMTDIVVDGALALAKTGNLADSGIAAARKAMLDRLPGPAKDIGGTVFDTLAHVVLGSVHKAPTHAVVTPAPAKGFPPKVAVLRTPAHYAVLGKVAATQAAKRAAPKKVIRFAPPTVKAIARAAPKPAVVPVHAMAPPPRPVATTRPLTLDMIVRAYQPEVIRHMIAVPKGVKHS